jgi:putative ABC transport system substrate-binding protein
MRKRQFITLLGGAITWPFMASAQQRRGIPRVGVLWHAANAKEEEEYLGALTKAFHDLGYVEGKNIEKSGKEVGLIDRDIRGEDRR